MQRIIVSSRFRASSSANRERIFTSQLIQLRFETIGLFCLQMEKTLIWQSSEYQLRTVNERVSNLQTSDEKMHSRPEPERITSPNAKVRRLGYFVLFSKMLQKKRFSCVSLQNRILEKTVQEENRTLLEQACKELRVRRRTPVMITGEIRSEDAFRRYLGTAIEMGLIQKTSGRLYNTKRGEVLSVLSRNNNPFKLSLAQSYLLLMIILDKDYDYISSVVRCSIRNGKDEYKDFFERVTKIWRQKLENLDFKSAKTYDTLRKAISTEWKDKKTYYRDIIRASRLEWLLDLKVIEYWSIKTNRVVFREGIENLLDRKNFSYTFVTYMQSLVKGSIVYWREIPLQKRTELVGEILKQSFRLFETVDALPKISANQLLEYGLSVLAGSGHVCSIEELDNAVKKFIMSNLDTYRYVTIISEADRGYISKL